MIKIILLITVIFCTSCVKTTTDYFFNDTAIIFSNKSKFGYNPESIYVLKKNVPICLDVVNNQGLYVPWEYTHSESLNDYLEKLFNIKDKITQEEDMNINSEVYVGNLSKGTKLKASRVRRSSTYFILLPFIPFVQGIYNYLEVIDGNYKGKEIDVHFLSEMKDDFEPFHQKYKDAMPSNKFFNKIKDNEKTKLKLNTVPEAKIQFLN